jgi:hypothetical protein
MLLLDMNEYTYLPADNFFLLTRQIRHQLLFVMSEEREGWCGLKSFRFQRSFPQHLGLLFTMMLYSYIAAGASFTVSIGDRLVEVLQMLQGPFVPFLSPALLNTLQLWS